MKKEQYIINNLILFKKSIIEIETERDKQNKNLKIMTGKLNDFFIEYKNFYEDYKNYIEQNKNLFKNLNHICATIFLIENDYKSKKPAALDMQYLIKINAEFCNYSLHFLSGIKKALDKSYTLLTGKKLFIDTKKSKQTKQIEPQQEPAGDERGDKNGNNKIIFYIINAKKPCNKLSEMTINVKAGKYEIKDVRLRFEKDKFNNERYLCNLILSFIGSRGKCNIFENTFNPQEDIKNPIYSISKYIDIINKLLQKDNKNLDLKNYISGRKPNRRINIQVENKTNPYIKLP